MKIRLLVPVALLLFMLVSSCSTTKNTSTNTTKKENSKEMTLKDSETSSEFALEAYLNRTAGVIVQGSGVNATVQVRGVNSFSGNTEPLFIINGTDVGSSYANAAGLLRGMDITSVEVLKGSDASFYGVRGSGGVIVIKAK